VRRGVLAVGVCTALLLCGCGGSDDSASTTRTSSEMTTTPQVSSQSSTPLPDKSHQGSGKQNEGEPSGSSPQGEGSRKPGSSPKQHLHLVKAPPISSRPKAGSKAPAPGVETVKGGDNSVQEYGVEAGESERTEAAIALQGYLNARATEDWGTACSLLAKKPTEQLEKISGHKAGCAEVLAATGKGAPSMPGSVIGEVLSFRGGGDIEGNPSYLIFTGPPGATLFSMPMYLQGGAWKVGLAQPSELPV
jgi:hypothetical protein